MFTYIPAILASHDLLLILAIVSIAEGRSKAMQCAQGQVIECI